jgi:hypothetical protein
MALRLTETAHNKKILIRLADGKTFLRIPFAPQHSQIFPELLDGEPEKSSRRIVSTSRLSRG